LKKIILIILSLLLIISLTACSEDAYQEYIEAVNKTNDISKGQMSYDILIQNDFDTKGMSENEIRQLNYFKEIKTKASIMFDESENDTKVISRNYFNLGGMGFDSSFYLNGDKAFIKMPMLGKYMVLDEYTQESNNDDIKYSNELTGETIETLKDEWIKVLNEENVVSGNKILLTTEDGEVKATQFSINLNDEQISQLLNSFVDVISKDKSLENMMSFTDGNNEELDNDKMLDDLRDGISNVSIKNFKYTGYIDFDGYIIQEDLEFVIEYNTDESSKAISTSFSMQAKRWDIEKELSFEFPELTKENTLDDDNIEQGLPFIFDGLMLENGGN